MILSVGINALLSYLVLKHDKIIEHKIALQDQFGLDVHHRNKDNPWIIKTRQIIEGKKAGNEQDLIDSIRNYVNRHSIHEEKSEEFRLYAFNTPVVIQKLVENFESGKSPPHLSCTPRAWAMRSILNDFGFKNRIIQLYFPGEDEMFSHTFLEVFNPETRLWEVHDPDINLIYVDSLGNRLSIFAMKTKSEKGEVFYPKRGNEKGWHLSYLKLSSPDNFKIIAFRYLKERYLEDLVFIDQTQVNLDKRYSKNDNKNILEYFEGKNRIVLY